MYPWLKGDGRPCSRVYAESGISKHFLLPCSQSVGLMLTVESRFENGHLFETRKRQQQYAQLHII